MPVRHARHIALSAPLAAWVDEQVERGQYTSASDLVRVAIRQLQERAAADAQRSRKLPSNAAST